MKSALLRSPRAFMLLSFQIFHRGPRAGVPRVPGTRKGPPFLSEASEGSAAASQWHTRAIVLELDEIYDAEFAT